MSGPVDVLAVMEAESNRRLSNYNAAVHGDAPEALADRLHADLHEMATARAAVAELIPAAGGALMDLLAMIAAADRGEVWQVSVANRARAENLAAALARVQGGAA